MPGPDFAPAEEFLAVAVDYTTSTIFAAAIAWIIGHDFSLSFHIFYIGTIV